MTAATVRPAPPDSYAALVRRTRRLVERWVPTGGTVAVLSRGDPAMVTFADRVGWHLPCYDDGRYVGYHPADGDEAVRALEAVRARGAGYLLVPETSAWWLDHYTSLREHLAGTASVLAAEPGTAVLFALAAPAEDGAGRARMARDMAEIAGLLLPPGAWVAVIAEETVARALGADFRVASVALPAAGPDALRGAQFVVVPCVRYDWLRARDDVRRLLDREARLVTWQEHVGAIFEMVPPDEVGRT